MVPLCSCIVSLLLLSICCYFIDCVVSFLRRPIDKFIVLCISCYVMLSRTAELFNFPCDRVNTVDENENVFIHVRIK
jgi:hypothetical protein